MSHYPFASLVGYLLYFANSIRVDIHRAVLNLAAFMSFFGLKHWKAGLRVLCYLEVDPDKPKEFKDQGDKHNCRLTYDCDASFADNPDNGRSRFGVLGYCGDPDVEGGTAAFDQKGGELTARRVLYMI